MIYLSGNYQKIKEEIKSFDKEDLENHTINKHYNDFLRDASDYVNKDRDSRGFGKRIPYVGFFWRTLDFSSTELPIGNCGEFVGFMESNKWGYEERVTTVEEFAYIMTHIDSAMKASAAGGILSEIIANRDKHLDDLWDYLQTLEV